MGWCLWFLILSQLGLAQGLRILGADQAAPFFSGLLAPSDAAGLSPSSELSDGKQTVGIYEIHRDGAKPWVHGVLFSGGSRHRMRPRAGARMGFTPIGQFDGTLFAMEEGSWKVDAQSSGVIEVLGITLQVEGSELALTSFELTHRCGVHASAEWVGLCSGASARLRLELWRGLPRADLTLSLQAPEAVTFPAGLDLVVRGLSHQGVQNPLDGSSEEDAEPVTTRFPDSGGIKIPGAAASAALHVRHPHGFEGPGAVTSDPRSGELRVHWLAGGTTLLRGEGRLLRLMLEAGRDPAEPGLAIGDAYLRTERAHFGQWPTHPLADRVDREVEQFLTDPARGRIMRGEGAGDYRFSAWDVGNLEFDTVLGLLTYAILKGDRRAFLAAWAAGDHQLTYDRDALGTGLFFPHGGGHRAAPVEWGHHWIEGLTLLSRGIHDPYLSWALEEVLAAQPPQIMNRDLRNELPRSLSWALLALSVQWDGNRADRPARDALQKLRQHLLNAQHGSGWLDLGGGKGEHFQVSPFVQVGIFLPALARSLDLIPDAYGQAAMGRLIQAVLRDGIRENPESRRSEVAKSLRVSRRGAEAPTFGGVAHDEQVALILAGLHRARDRLKSHPELRRLRKDLGQNLYLAEKRFVGPEISILLRALPWL